MTQKQGYSGLKGLWLDYKLQQSKFIWYYKQNKINNKNVNIYYIQVQYIHYKSIILIIIIINSIDCYKQIKNRPYKKSYITISLKHKDSNCYHPLAINYSLQEVQYQQSTKCQPHLKSATSPQQFQFAPNKTDPCQGSPTVCCTKVLW